MKFSKNKIAKLPIMEVSIEIFLLSGIKIYFQVYIPSELNSVDRLWSFLRRQSSLERR